MRIVEEGEKSPQPRRHPTRRQVVSSLLAIGVSAAGVKKAFDWKESREKAAARREAVAAMAARLKKMGVHPEAAHLLSEINRDLYAEHMDALQLSAIDRHARKFGKLGIHPVRVVRTFENFSPQFRDFVDDEELAQVIKNRNLIRRNFEASHRKDRSLVVMLDAHDEKNPDRDLLIQANRVIITAAGSGDKLIENYGKYFRRPYPK